MAVSIPAPIPRPLAASKIAPSRAGRLAWNRCGEKIMAFLWPPSGAGSWAGANGASNRIPGPVLEEIAESARGGKSPLRPLPAAPHDKTYLAFIFNFIAFSQPRKPLAIGRARLVQ